MTCEYCGKNITIKSHQKQRLCNTKCANRYNAKKLREKFKNNLIPKEKLIKLYYTDNLNLRQLAKKIGVNSHNTISNWLRFYNIPRKDPSLTYFKKEQHTSPETEFKKGNIPWNTGRWIKKICEECGREYKVILSQAKGSKFCSRTCAGRVYGRKSRPKIKFKLSKDELNELYWKKKLIGKEIDKIAGCCSGTTLYWLRKYGIKVRSYSEAFKGRETKPKHREKLREATLRAYKTGKKQPLAGSKNPNWRGGREPYYGPNWYKQRNKCLERDNHICQFCGAKENGRKHDIHHKIPFRIFGVKLYKEANDLENLITLCRSCHTQEEWKQNKMEFF